MTALNALRTRVDDDIDPPSVLVISDSYVGSSVVTALKQTADTCLVTDQDGVAMRAPEGVRVVVGDEIRRALLNDASADDADAAVISMRTDHSNLLMTQLLRTEFDTDRVVVLLNDTQCSPAFEDIASALVCRSSVLATELERTLETTLPPSETA